MKAAPAEDGVRPEKVEGIVATRAAMRRGGQW